MTASASKRIEPTRNGTTEERERLEAMPLLDFVTSAYLWWAADDSDDRDVSDFRFEFIRLGIHGGTLLSVEKAIDTFTPQEVRDLGKDIMTLWSVNPIEIFKTLDC